MITFLILVVSSLVLVDGECQTDDGPIKKTAVVLAMATLISMQRVQESTLLVTLVE